MYRIPREQWYYSRFVIWIANDTSLPVREEFYWDRDLPDDLFDPGKLPDAASSSVWTAPGR